MMKCYSLDVGQIDTFVDTVLVSGHTKWDGERALKGSFAFVCSHDHGDHLRECSVCGPVILSSLASEVQLQGLNGRLQCYACTAVAETPGEMIFFIADDDATCQCLLYSEVFPGYLRQMFSNLFGDGTLIMYVLSILQF